MSTKQIVTTETELVRARSTASPQGTVAILGYGGSYPAGVLWREYSTTDEVAVDWGTTTPEYRAAEGMLGQEPGVNKLVILKGATPPTQRYKIAVKSVANSTAYKFRIGDEEISVNSDSSATNDEIVTALVNAVTAAAISGLVGSSQGSAPSTYVRLLASAAGTWFDVEVLTPTLLSIELDHADPGVAADLSAIEETEPSYYYLSTLYNSKAYVEAVAGWVATREKFYLGDMVDSAIEDDSYSGATDAAKGNVTASRSRTEVIYHHDPGQFFAARVLGKTATYLPGERAWFGSVIDGVTYRAKTTTQRNNLEQKRCGFYERFGPSDYGLSDTFRIGSGPFVEARVGVDAFNRLAVSLIVALLLKGRTGLDDDGLTAIAGEIKSAIRTFISYGFFLGDAETLEGGPTVKIPTRAGLSAQEQETRKVTSFDVDGELRGFVQAVDFKSTITVA